MKKKVAVLMVMVILFASAVAIGLSEPAEAPEEEQYTPEELLSIWYQIGSMLKEYGSYPYVELERGDRGYEVRLLQIRLAELNYYFKAIDDTFGSGTYAGMRRFERVNGLHVDGVASVEDQRLLFSGGALNNTGNSGYTEDTGDAGDAGDTGDTEEDGNEDVPGPTAWMTIDPDVFRTLRPVMPVYSMMPLATPKSTIDLSDMFDRFRHK